MRAVNVLFLAAVGFIQCKPVSRANYFLQLACVTVLAVVDVKVR